MGSDLTNRLRVHRAEQGISQGDLADAIGVSRKTISTIEVGRFTPSTVIALKLARHFGVSVEALFQLDMPERNAAE
jgi:putative transcriptional regulator